MVVVFDIETLGLDAFQHEVVLIGIKKEGKIVQWKLWKSKDELEMILNCLETLRSVPFNETIVGYNNLKFDVPFITTRLQVKGKWTPALWSLLYRDRKWFDLYQFLGNDFRNMTFWLDKLGIKRRFTDIHGRDVPIFHDLKDYRKIEQHNRDDLVTSEKLYLKLKKQFPELIRM